MNAFVVLITNALTSIGRATALAFAQEGAQIVISGQRDEAGHKLVADLRARSAEAEYVHADPHHEEEARNLIDQTVARFGRLDVAINNAVTEGQPTPVTEQTTESYAAIFDINVLGTLMSMKHELRVMLAQGHGSIVNVSFAYGWADTAGTAVYVASKYAVEGLTKAVALEVAEGGVRVNVIAPGPVETGILDQFTDTARVKFDLISQIPLKRMGLPDEIAQAIVFLASGKASFITGASLSVDGGKPAR